MWMHRAIITRYLVVLVWHDHMGGEHEGRFELTGDMIDPLVAP